MPVVGGSDMDARIQDLSDRLDDLEAGMRRAMASIGEMRAAQSSLASWVPWLQRLHLWLATAVSSFPWR